MSRESKIAALESLLVRVQCRANEPRASQIIAVAAPAARANVAVAAVEPVVAPIARQPIMREERESLPPWPEPEPEARLVPVEEPPPELIPIDESGPQLVPVEEPPELIPIDDSAPQLEVVEEEDEEPEPSSAPRFREEAVEEQVAAASQEEEYEDPITLPPVSGRQVAQGALADLVTLPPGSERKGAALEMDIGGDGESTPPPPAPRPIDLRPSPIELVESAEPPPVAESAEPSVRLMVEPLPRAPGMARMAPVAIEVRASVIRPAARSAATVAAFEGAAKKFVPTTFGDLLDATLALGGD